MPCLIPENCRPKHLLLSALPVLRFCTILFSSDSSSCYSLLRFHIVSPLFIYLRSSIPASSSSCFHSPSHPVTFLQLGPHLRFHNMNISSEEAAELADALRLMRQMVSDFLPLSATGIAVIPHYLQRAQQSAQGSQPVANGQQSSVNQAFEPSITTQQATNPSSSRASSLPRVAPFAGFSNRTIPDAVAAPPPSPTIPIPSTGNSSGLRGVSSARFSGTARSRANQARVEAAASHHRPGRPPGRSNQNAPSLGRSAVVTSQRPQRINLEVLLYPSIVCDLPMSMCAVQHEADLLLGPFPACTPTCTLPSVATVSSTHG